jgi:hypothetical protein
MSGFFTYSFKTKQNEIYRMKTYKELWVLKRTISVVNISLKRYDIEPKMLSQRHNYSSTYPENFM